MKSILARVACSTLLGLVLFAAAARAQLSSTPDIAGIPNQAMPKSTSLAVPFAVSHQTMTFAVSSTNATLFPSGSIVVTDGALPPATSPSTAKNVTLTPSFGLSGSATITITGTVPNQATQPTTVFTVTVTDTNTAAPTFGGAGTIDDQVVPLTTTSVAPTITVTDSQTAAGSLIVSAVATQQGATPLVSSVSAVNSGGNVTVTVNFTAGATGTSIVTLKVEDSATSAEKLWSTTSFLVARVDPSGTDNQLRRLGGLYVLDDSAGTPYDPDLGGPLPSYMLRDTNISLTNNNFIDGYVLRASWLNLEIADGVYDFKIIENALGLLPSGKKLSLIIVPQDPTYLQSISPSDWYNDVLKPGGSPIPRIVPWNTTQRAKRNAFLQALADHEFTSGIAFRDDPRLDALDVYLPGGFTGIRNPLNRQFKDMDAGSDANRNITNGYSRANMLYAVRDELITLTTEFPSTRVHVGFFKILDDAADHPGDSTPLWEYLYNQITGEFDGVTRPRVGVFLENLSTSRATPSSTSITGKPEAANNQPADNGQHITWTALQALGSWRAPNSPGFVNLNDNSTPAEGLDFGFNTFNTRYYELYRDDVTFPAYAAELKRWHDLFVLPTANAQTANLVGSTPTVITLSGSTTHSNLPLAYTIETPPSHGSLGTVTGNQVTYTANSGYVGTDAFMFSVRDGLSVSNEAIVDLTVAAPSTPTGLTATPVSTTQINVSWTAVPESGATYNIERSVNGGSFSTLQPNVSGTTFSDTSGTQGNLYTYQIQAVSTAGTSGWSATRSALTWIESNAGEDGYTTGTGAANSTATTIRIGRASGTALYRGFLSFDTTNLPATFTITALKIRLRVESLNATVSTLGMGTVDIDSPGFSGSESLQTTDANDPPAAAGVGGFVNSTADEDFLEINPIASGAYPFVNTGGKTQFRLSFPSASAQNTYLAYYSGNSTTAANRPVLIVEFQ